MDLERLFIYFLAINSISAIILLVYPQRNGLVKGIFVSLLSSFWIYLSICFLGFNFAYIFSDNYIVLFFMYIVIGGGISFFSGCAIMALFIKKTKSSSNFVE